MIGTIEIECNAKNPNFPLYPMRAFVGSPSSLRILNVPKKIGTWQITSVTLQAVYPDGSAHTADCVLTGGCWVGTIDGSLRAGINQSGYTVYASGIDEHGDPVEGYVLGKGDVVIMEANGNIPPDAFAELSAEVQWKRDLDDFGIPSQPTDTVPVWYGDVKCAWDPQDEMWKSEDGFVEVKRVDGTEYYDVTVFQQLEPEKIARVVARVRLALPGYYDFVKDGDQEVEVRSFDGQLVSDKDIGYYVDAKLSGISSELNLSAYVTKEYVDGEVSGKADLSALDGYYEKSETSSSQEIETAFANYWNKNQTSSSVQIEKALSAKQDSIPADQTEALSAATNDYKTTMWFDDGTVSSFAWYGPYNFQRNYDAGLYDPDARVWRKNPVTVKIGRGITLITGGLNSTLSLDTVFIPDTVSAMVNAFQGSGIRTVTLPYGLNNIGATCFAKCFNLSSAYFPETVETINQYAFLNCGSLTIVQLPKYLRGIGDECFSGCSSLTSISIPDSVLSIGWKAFKYCTNLQRVELGSGLTRLRHQAFDKCPNLTCVLFKDKTMEQISAMQDYPWSLSSTSIISTWNTADEEWVHDEVRYLNLPDGTTALEDRAVQRVELSSAQTTMVLPPDGARTVDFVVDVVNGYQESGTPSTAAFTLSGTIGEDFAVVVPEGQSLAEMTTLAGGELAEYYFTKTAFELSGLTTWKVVKQTVESWTPETV